MPRTTLTNMVVGLLLLVPAFGRTAAIDIPGSKHDLSVPHDSSGYECCYVCHSPHTIAGSQKPLWHQTNDLDKFTAYNSSASEGYDTLKDDGGLAICLSCHDGTIAPTSVYVESSLAAVDQLNPASSGKSYSTAADHPVNIVYFDYESDPQIRPAVSPDEVTDGIISLTLYNGRVQCGSCHDVHNGSGASFLRVSNQGSQLCTVCHLK